MEFLIETTYNRGMSAKDPITTTELLPDVDLVELVKTVRKFAGLSQRELADKLGCSRRNVEDWERSISAPSGQYLAKLFVLREQLMTKLAIPLKGTSSSESQQQTN